MENLHKNIELMLEFLKGLFLVLHFSYYTLMTFLMMFSEVLLSMPMIVLSVATTKIGFWTWIWHTRHRTGAVSGLLISMLEKLWLSPLNWAGAASKKIGALIRSTKFLSPKVTLYFCKFTIRSCMEYCCHIWAGVPSCYLELLDKLQKQVCKTVGASLLSLLNPWLIVKM